LLNDKVNTVVSQSGSTTTSPTTPWSWPPLLRFDDKPVLDARSADTPVDRLPVRARRPRGVVIDPPCAEGGVNIMA
jgi:hypothetical protein